MKEHRDERAVSPVIATLLLVAVSIAAVVIALSLLTPPYVKLFNGSTGVTVTEQFTIVKQNWDVQITYFRRWGTFWSMRMEVYSVGSETPAFVTYVALLTEPSGVERVEFSSHQRLPPGQYYLKIFSDNVIWSLKIVEW